MASFVTCTLHYFAYSLCMITAGAIILGNTFIDYSFFTIIKLLIAPFILHCAFYCLMLLFYILPNSTTFTVIAELLITFKIPNDVYVLIERFTHFNINLFMLIPISFRLECAMQNQYMQGLLL